MTSFARGCKHVTSRAALPPYLDRADVSETEIEIDRVESFAGIQFQTRPYTPISRRLVLCTDMFLGLIYQTKPSPPLKLSVPS